MKHSILTSLLLTCFLSIATIAMPSAAGSGRVDEARTLIEQGDYAAAKTLIEARLAENPEDADAWQAMGLACFGMRWFEDASDSFSKADEFQPDDGLTLFYRGVLILLETTKRDKDARAFFDRSAALDSSRNDSANLMKFAMMKYITIPGRSVTKEFDAWREGLDPDSWVGQIAMYMRRPVSNEKFIEQSLAHQTEANATLIDVQRHFYIGLRCERSLHGLAATSLKEGLLYDAAGTVEWELSRAWFYRIAKTYNWETKLGFEYAPNETGALQAVIQDRESFALARGLENGDVIVGLNGMEADYMLLEATFADMKIGDAYTLEVQREEGKVELLLVVDTKDFRMRAATPR